MRITRVLKDHQRRSRFNKLNKANQAVPRVGYQVKNQAVPRPLCVSSHMQNKWFSTTLAQICRAQALGHGYKSWWCSTEKQLSIEYTYGLDNLKVRSWETFKRSMRFNFGKYILPRFQEVSELSTHDIGQIMNSSTAGIAQFFRSCQAFLMGSQKVLKMDKKPSTCYIYCFTSKALK